MDLQLESDEKVKNTYGYSQRPILKAFLAIVIPVTLIFTLGYLFSPSIGLLFVLLMSVIIIAGVGINILILTLTVKMYVTNKRVLATYPGVNGGAWFLLSLDLKDVKEVKMYKDLLGNLLGYYSIKVIPNDKKDVQNLLGIALVIPSRTIQTMGFLDEGPASALKNQIEQSVKEVSYDVKLQRQIEMDRRTSIKQKRNRDVILYVLFSALILTFMIIGALQTHNLSIKIINGSTTVAELPNGQYPVYCYVGSGLGSCGVYAPNGDLCGYYANLPNSGNFIPGSTVCLVLIADVGYAPSGVALRGSGYTGGCANSSYGCVASFTMPSQSVTEAAYFSQST